jgi:hypothetical protein
MPKSAFSLARILFIGAAEALWLIKTLAMARTVTAKKALILRMKFVLLRSRNGAAFAR